MIGGYLGARYTNRFKESNLKRLIELVLIVVVFTMFFRVDDIITREESLLARLSLLSTKTDSEILMTGISGQHVMKAAEFIGYEIKENTELAEFLVNPLLLGRGLFLSFHLLDLSQL